MDRIQALTMDDICAVGVCDDRAVVEPKRRRIQKKRWRRFGERDRANIDVGRPEHARIERGEGRPDKEIANPICAVRLG